nr:YetF domain-containing protein [Cohnella sp. CFH 77786]
MVTVLAIGTIIGHAVTENELWKTLVCISLFILILLAFQFLALKFRWVERVIIGRPTLIIRDGQIIRRNLTKLRMTTEQLELRFREIGISNLSDIRTATIEINGQIGYELTESAQPLTRGQAEQILALLKLQLPPSTGNTDALFEEIRRSDG